MAPAQALFCGVWLMAFAAQLYTIELAEKHPETYRNEAKYRGPMARVDTLMMKPIAATPMGMLM